MQFDDLQKRALEIRNKYDQLNQKHDVPVWQASDYMAGLVGDIGDLSKLVMAKHGSRVIDDLDNKLPHELADCLWSLLVLADLYHIDLIEAFVTTMDELDARLASKGVN